MRQCGRTVLARRVVGLALMTLSALALFVAGGLIGLSVAAADDRSDAAAIEAAAAALVKEFNAAKTEAVVARFLPRGELIDDEGTAYQGREELQALFTQYFAQFPGATLELSPQGIRIVGEGLAIEEGARSLTTKDGAQAQVRYVTVWAKADGQWRIASTREVKSDPPPAPGDRLAPLAWLEGDWISEGPEAVVTVSYRWSDDRNFLLGEFRTSREGRPLVKSTQRIGWDPLAGNIRSWLFDSDGGFAEGSWSLVDDGWVIKSQATLPEGISGSATVKVAPLGKNEFLMTGTDRIIGDRQEDDFELTITRAPPAVKATAAPRQ